MGLNKSSKSLWIKRRLSNYLKYIEIIGMHKAWKILLSWQADKWFFSWTTPCFSLKKMVHYWLYELSADLWGLVVRSSSLFIIKASTIEERKKNCIMSVIKSQKIKKKYLYDFLLKKKANFVIIVLLFFLPQGYVFTHDKFRTRITISEIKLVI